MIIDAKHIVKTFNDGPVETHVLRGIDLQVPKGEFLAIMGRSGAGKSTLLYQLSLLDHPTSGKIVIDGKDVSTLKGNERVNFRLNELGFIFQDYANLPELSAVENVLLPLLMSGVPRQSARTIAEQALARVGLKDRYNNLPNQLSGGEQQRVSIARAIVHKPKIIFADEPTASLDSDNAQVVIDLLEELNAAGQTIVMVTHEAEYTTHCDRVIELRDGKILKIKKKR